MDDSLRFDARSMPHDELSDGYCEEGVLTLSEQRMFHICDREKIGRWAEDLAADFLRRQGMNVLARNVRSRSSEIDIVGVVREELIFAEVRCRRKNNMMSALESIGPQKWRHMVHGAEAYVQKNAWNKDWRIDLIAIDVDMPHWHLHWYRYLEMEDERYGS